MAIIVSVIRSNFHTDAGIILFGNASLVLNGILYQETPQYPLSTINPLYTPSIYGGVVGAPTVNFKGFFLGQRLGVGAEIPVGASATGVVVGTPTNPLTLDPASPDTFIKIDGATPTSPVLSGNPLFNGPIAILFDKDLVAVGMDAGVFNATQSTAITAYSRSGVVLGSVVNQSLGIEFFGLATIDGTATIAGVLFSIVGLEPAGYAIDNLTMALSGQITVPIFPRDGFTYTLTGNYAPPATSCDSNLTKSVTDSSTNSCKVVF